MLKSKSPIIGFTFLADLECCIFCIKTGTESISNHKSIINFRFYMIKACISGTIVEIIRKAINLKSILFSAFQSGFTKKMLGNFFIKLDIYNYKIGSFAIF